MHSRKEEILNTLKKQPKGMTAIQIADLLNLDRSNVSRYLNELHKGNKIVKSEGRPVVYSLMPENEDFAENSGGVSFDDLVGEKDSLKVSIQQAKAAILYPPRGLHTIIFGETGTGKSMFAECMYSFAVESGTLPVDAPFISFNCADYAQNPQLLYGHIFGIKKGAYTGAEKDSSGLIATADGGILFLDEIHRLPPEGQEMLFTFIDKGIYRPLGENSQTFHASVQIIGATTETSETFLTTFNRRIPMSIQLPNLASRSVDERYDIISLFIKQEANRLNQSIKIERESLLAFMLYDAEGNIGQVKRDLKLVCAKAFLHYRTHEEDNLTIHKEDLSLTVQKGLLKIKELPDRMERFLENKGQFLTFEPGSSEIVWSRDPERNMQVYNKIEEKVTELAKDGLGEVDLEELISKDVDAYFPAYVEELTQSSIHKELIPDNIWSLTNRLYDIAEERLARRYNEKARFAFALHLQSTIERIKEGHKVSHPDLNNIRKNLKKEFKTAIDLSAIIEEEENIEIPFDEIGFISMFLSISVGESEQNKENPVEVIVLMHGSSTASSMLETAQELLGTKLGMAFNMPLIMEVQTMYNQLLNYIRQQQDRLSNGVILLTDMGSLNSFGNLIYEETGICTKAITMTSTMIVLEALRMANVGRSLEDIYQNIQMSFETIIRDQFHRNKKYPQKTKKAIVVTCFTGEGVAAKLYQRIEPVIDKSKVELIQMQFLEKDTFKKHIDRLMEEYEIKAIAGTVEIEYQNIPFFSAYDIFDDNKLEILERIANDEIPTEKIIAALSNELTHIDSVQKLVHQLQRTLQRVQTEMHATVEPSVGAGILLHLAVLVDNLLDGGKGRQFKNLEEFTRSNRLEMDIIHTNLLTIEKNYGVHFSQDEMAIVVQMIQENRLDNQQKRTKKYSCESDFYRNS